MNNNECSVYKKCSGCQLMNMEYSRQLKWKQIKVERLMNVFGKVNRIVGMDNPTTTEIRFKPFSEQQREVK